MNLKRIGNSKFPTELQLKNIISNLKVKYPNDKFVISIEISSNHLTDYSYSLYRRTGNKESYPIFVVGWSDFLEEYREIMRGENDE